MEFALLVSGHTRSARVAATLILVWPEVAGRSLRRRGAAGDDRRFHGSVCDHPRRSRPSRRCGTRRDPRPCFDVIDRARAKTGGRELDAGERTAWSVFDSAWKNDDSIVADYLGGILAASDDDTGVPIAAQIARLSSLDLRLHFALYRTYQPFISISVEVDRPESITYPDLYVSKVDLLAACGLPESAIGIVRAGAGTAEPQP